MTGVQTCALPISPKTTSGKEEILAIILKGHRSFQATALELHGLQCPGKGTLPRHWHPPETLVAAAAGPSFPELGWPAHCLPPEELTPHPPAAMAPGCQLASEGLLCPQEAGSRRLARGALGFARETERQLFVLPTASHLLNQGGAHCSAKGDRKSTRLNSSH